MFLEPFRNLLFFNKNIMEIDEIAGIAPLNLIFLVSLSELTIQFNSMCRL
jgi:hypothetical protein